MRNKSPLEIVEKLLNNLEEIDRFEDSEYNKIIYYEYFNFNNEDKIYRVNLINQLGKFLGFKNILKNMVNSSNLTICEVTNFCIDNITIYRLDDLYNIILQNEK